MGVLGWAAGLFIVQLEGQALRAQGGECGGSLSCADRKHKEQEALESCVGVPGQPDGAGMK